MDDMYTATFCVLSIQFSLAGTWVAEVAPQSEPPFTSLVVAEAIPKHSTNTDNNEINARYNLKSDPPISVFKEVYLFNKFKFYSINSH